MPESCIAFNDFSYTYEDGACALSGVTFSISRGESVGLIGHNGSGKSTLLMHTVGILEPDSRVIVSGLPVTRENLKTIRRRVGYVFQNPRDQLFMSTVAEDVAFGPLNMGMPPAEALRAAEKALSLVGLDGFGERTPYHLSGGEMRRASIATVLSTSPFIVVMDEPSSGLDPRAKRELALLIRSLTCTRLISSHDLDFIRDCTDRIILLNHGRIVADGPAGEILGDRALLEENGL
ncbi:MAG: ABC transporter ATP-binding protein [Candidatus Latescibacterota bacterium]